MRGSQRQPTSVIVKVIDISAYTAEALKRYNDKHPDDKATKVSTSYQWGYVETPNGIMVLCDEGVGPGTPITADNPLKIDLHAEWDTNEGRRFDMLPCLILQLNDNEIKAAKIVKEVNLADFIRQFGHRLEVNYNQWKAALEKPKKKLTKKQRIAAAMASPLVGIQ